MKGRLRGREEGRNGLGRKKEGKGVWEDRKREEGDKKEELLRKGGSDEVELRR